MDDSILFYIIIPVFNGEDYIDQCIESVYRQSYNNYKIVMVDDGSCDNSFSLCEQYARKDARIVVLHQDNRGQLASRDTAVRYVISHNSSIDSAFFVFLDVDDQLKDKALFEIKSAIDEYGCDIVVFGFDRVIGDGTIVKSYCPERHYSGCIDNKRLLYKVILGNNNYNSMCTKAISVKLYSDVDYEDFYHVRHGEDLVQSLSYLKNSNKVLFLNEALYNYRVNLNSVSNKINCDNYDFGSKVREYVWQFIKSEAVWTEEDFEEYALFCKRLLIRKINTVAKFNVSLKKRRDMMSQMRHNAYYSQLLESYGGNGIVLFLFQQEQYLFLCLLIVLGSKSVELFKAIKDIIRIG